MCKFKISFFPENTIQILQRVYLSNVLFIAGRTFVFLKKSMLLYERYEHVCNIQFHVSSLSPIAFETKEILGEQNVK